MSSTVKPILINPARHFRMTPSVQIILISNHLVLVVMVISFSMKKGVLKWWSLPHALRDFY